MIERNSGKAKGRKIEIERNQNSVHFIMQFDSEYDAMMLYDRMTEEMRSGSVKLEIVLALHRALRHD